MSGKRTMNQEVKILNPKYRVNTWKVVIKEFSEELFMKAKHLILRNWEKNDALDLK